MAIAMRRGGPDRLAVATPFRDTTPPPRSADAATAEMLDTGFVDAAAIGGYSASPHNRFMTLDLTGA